MSEPQQPPVPSSQPEASGAGIAPQGYPAAAPQGYPAAAPQAYPTAAPQAYPAAAPQAYPTAAPQGYPTHYPSAAPGFPSSSAPAAGHGTGLARTALIVAAATFAVDLVSVLARPFTYTSGFGYEAASALDNAFSVLAILAYGTALVLGIMAARRSPSLVAGIAIGIAGVGVVALSVSWLSVLAYQFV